MSVTFEQPVQRLLLVEDSVSFSYWVKAKLEKDAGLEIVLARSLSEAEEAIQIFKGEFFLAILDLNLPDAAGDDVVFLASSNKIPSIAFTGTYSEDMRDKLFSLGVIDYLIKDNQHSMNYIISLVRRIRANMNCTALVVDDSATSRSQAAGLLKKYRFKVVEASSGQEALDLLDKIPDIRLVITDYNMPGMDGCELTKLIRQRHQPNRLAVIGVSAHGSGPLSAKFLKFGANDFLNKPFYREEFFCRVTQNMEHLDLVAALTETAMHDPITNLHNRRYFFELVKALSAQTRRDEKPFSAAVIAIDHMQKVSESFGQRARDHAVRHVAELIKSELHRQSDLAARYGGEAFCVYLHDTDASAAASVMERLRERIEKSPLTSGSHSISMTVSIGLATSSAEEVADVMAKADRALSRATETGQNRVIHADQIGDELWSAA